MARLARPIQKDDAGCDVERLEAGEDGRGWALFSLPGLPFAWVSEILETTDTRENPAWGEKPYERYWDEVARGETKH